MAYPYVYYSLNLVLYLKNCIIALRFLKKGGTLHLVLNTGLPNKATLDFFDIIGSMFGNYKIHMKRYELFQYYIPIDLINFKGINEKELDNLYRLYDKCLLNQYNIYDLIHYTTNKKLSTYNILNGYNIKKLTLKIQKSKSIEILSQLKDDSNHTSMSKNINNYVEFITIQRIYNIKYIYNTFYPIEEKIKDDNFIKNIYQVIFRDEVQNLVNIYDEYNLPNTDFLNKANNYFTQSILKDLYDVNDYTKFLINTDEYNLPKEISNGTRAFTYIELDDLNEKNNIVRFHRSEYEASGYQEYQYKAKKRLTILRDNLKPILKSKLNLKLMPNNAFIKLFEILKLNPYLISKKRNINTFHLAEAPGHFIKSVEAYIKQRDLQYGQTTKFEWWANSLNPYNATVRKNFNTLIGDDYNLIKNNPNRWLWGKDNTGDITNPENLIHMKNFMRKRNITLDLVTGDAGLAVRESSLELLQKIDLAQAIGSTYMTDINKHVILKHFTPFIRKLYESVEASGYFVSLIYFYACCFKKIYIMKPVSSSNLGGEFYLVGYQKKADVDKKIEMYLNKLPTFKVNQPLFFKKDIPDKFFYQVYKFLDILIGSNIKAISYHNYITNCIIRENTDDKVEQCNELSEEKLKKVSNEKIKEWFKMYI